MSLIDHFSRKPNRPEFVQMVKRALEKAGVEKVQKIPGDFALKVGEGDSTIFLSNVYSNYCSAPRIQRSSVLAEFVSAAAAMPTLPDIPAEFAAAKPGLMPAIRDAAYFSIFGLLQRRNGRPERALEVVTKPLVGGLVVDLVYDTERNITSINRDQLEQWGVSLEQAFAAAKDNLWDRTDPERMAGRGGVYWSQWSDSYDSSRILLPELIYRLAVDGDPVAFVPNRNELWVTGTNNSAGLAVILKEGLDGHFKRGHPLSPELYVLADGKWQVYVPEEPALRELWRTLKIRREALDYAQQQELLNAIHEQDGTDIFVASYKVCERKDGFAYSVCVWSNGVDSTLPVAENIAFMVDPEGGDHFVVRWEDAAPIVGDLMEKETEFVPVRYRAREFPGAEQIAKLRRVAV